MESFSLQCALLLTELTFLFCCLTMIVLRDAAFRFAMKKFMSSSTKQNKTTKTRMSDNVRSISRTLRTMISYLVPVKNQRHSSVRT